MDDFFNNLKKNLVEEVVAKKGAIEEYSARKFRKIFEELNAVYLGFEAISVEYSLIESAVTTLLGEQKEKKKKKKKKSEGEEETDEENVEPPLIQVWKDSAKEKAAAFKQFLSRKSEPLLIVIDNLFKRKISSVLEAASDGIPENTELKDILRNKEKEMLLTRFNKVKLKKINETINSSKEELINYLKLRKKEFDDVYLSGFNPEDYAELGFAYYLEELEKQAKDPKEPFFAVASGPEPMTIKAWINNFFDSNYNIIFSENKKARDIELFNFLKKYNSSFQKILKHIKDVEKKLTAYKKFSSKTAFKYSQLMREYIEKND